MRLYRLQSTNQGSASGDSPLDQSARTNSPSQALVRGSDHHFKVLPRDDVTHHLVNRYRSTELPQASPAVTSSESCRASAWSLWRHNRYDTILFIANFILQGIPTREILALSLTGDFPSTKPFSSRAAPNFPSDRRLSWRHNLFHHNDVIMSFLAVVATEF